ncbi:MAG: flagellar hook-associated protein FlgL [Deltaproteobacteria bacterium]|nr:flagellar hook-associated protein FlgL [Deltaproteobacteria bacterium]MBN2674730.1 flagellar hook-associated protein FlgL [Deltaproteobacteria bacterium]
MRITDQMIFRRSTRDIATQRSRMFTLQEQSATGKKFQSIDVEPVSAERVRMLREAKQEAQHYEKNITRSKTQLETADTALDEATNLLIRAKEIALAMGNELTQAPERTVSSQEIASLYDSMLNVANSEAAGEFIFAGFMTDTRPFQPDGSYVGDSNLKEVDVGPSSRAVVGVSGENAFTVAGGIDVFAEMEALRVALAADDDVGIQTAIGTIDQCIAQVTRSRTDVGLKLNRLDVSENVRQTLEDSLTKEESSVIDIDPVDTFMRLSETSNALQEAMAVAQKVTSNSLLTHL